MTREEELMSMTSDVLVQEHNKLDPRNQLPYWKKAKQKLVDMILELEAARAKKEASGKTIRETALDLLCEILYYEDKSKNPSPDNRVPADHPDARSVGHEYLAIIDAIKADFPDAETSVACLRWYAVKVRAGEFGYEDYRLVQRRPRAKPVR